ncbi:MAG: Gfo/Idh/MocA family protein [Anaerolineales bacterium]
MTRFLISGLGSIGRRHLRNLVALGEMDVVLHRSGLSTLPGDELDGFDVEADLAVALDRWRPDAVLVTNPTAHHLEVAIPAAQAGCHLFIEKPVSHSLDGIEALHQALTQSGGRSLVGYHFRFSPGLQEVKRLIGDRAVGRPIFARAYWGEYLPDWHPWEDYRASYSARPDLGGGAVLTLSHPFDYLRWLLGDVGEVQGMIGNSGTLGIDVEENAAAVLTMEGEILATVQLDYLRRPPAHWLEITGTEGLIRWDGLEGTVRWWDGEWRLESPPQGFERNSMFLDEMRHFLAVVAGEADPVCSLGDGVRALEIALAVHRSADTGRRVSMPSEAVRV